MKYKYFISLLPECNSDTVENGIFEFNFDILLSNKNLYKAQEIVEKDAYGDGRSLVFHSITPILNK